MLLPCSPEISLNHYQNWKSTMFQNTCSAASLSWSVNTCRSYRLRVAIGLSIQEFKIIQYDRHNRMKSIWMQASISPVTPPSYHIRANYLNLNTQWLAHKTLFRYNLLFPALLHKCIVRLPFHSTMNSSDIWTKSTPLNRFNQEKRRRR